MKNTTEQRIQKEKFQDNCLIFCQINGIHPLSKNVLKRCFRMPDGGITAVNKLMNLTNTFYPILMGNSFDSNVKQKLGHYDTNNNVIVFVYVDGNTYLTKDWSVLRILAQSGYKRGNLPVALCFGEEIVEPSLQREWEYLPKKSF